MKGVKNFVTTVQTAFVMKRVTVGEGGQKLSKIALRHLWPTPYRRLLKFWWTSNKNRQCKYDEARNTSDVIMLYFRSGEVSICDAKLLSSRRRCDASLWRHQRKVVPVSTSVDRCSRCEYEQFFSSQLWQPCKQSKAGNIEFGNIESRKRGLWTQMLLETTGT